MPIYEYECPTCRKVIEAMQKFSDAPLACCPDCQGPVTKLVSLSSFALKGSGWYTTDYKKSSAPAAAPASETSQAPAPAASSAPAATGSATPATATAPTSAPTSVPAKATPSKS